MILEEELTKIKVKNAELQQHLQGSQEHLQIIQRNYATMSGKVMGLEKEVTVAEDKLHEAAKCEAASKEATVFEAKQ